MADGRIVSKRISRSEKIASLTSDTARMFYTWLIPYLDVEGRIEGNPKLLKGDICPLLDHVTISVIDAILTELDAIGLIVLYEGPDKKRYIQLTRFEENQKNLRKDREAESIIPEPPIAAGVTPDSLPLKRREEKRSGNDEFDAESFASFWKAYPRRVNKKSAKRAWGKIRSPDLKIILAAIERHRESEQWKKNNGEFIPHPATWLNNERWTDELPEQTKKGKSAW